MSRTLEDCFDAIQPDDGKIVRIFNVEATMNYYKETIPYKRKSVLAYIESMLHWMNGIIIYARIDGKSNTKKDFVKTSVKMNEKFCREQTGLTDSNVKYAKDRLKELGVLNFKKKFKDPKKYWNNIWEISTLKIDDHDLGLYVSAKDKDNFRPLTEEEVTKIHKEFRFKEFSQILIESQELDELEEDLGELFNYKKNVFLDEEDKAKKQEILQSYNRDYWRIVNNTDVSKIRALFDRMNDIYVYYKDSAWLGLTEKVTLIKIATGEISLDHIVLEKIEKEYRDTFIHLLSLSKENYGTYLRRKSLRRLAYTKNLSPVAVSPYKIIVNSSKVSSVSVSYANKEYKKYMNL